MEKGIKTQKQPVRAYREIITHYMKIPRQIRESKPGPLDQEATTLPLSQAAGRICIWSKSIFNPVYKYL